MKQELPVAVIGSGPVGLAAAAHLAERRLPFLLLEQGPTVGHAIGQWAHVRVFSPWRFNIDRAARRLLDQQGWQAPDEDALPTGGEIVDRYLKPLAEHPAIAPHLRLSSRVTAVGRRDMDKVRTAGRVERPFEIRLADGERIAARAVIDASGTWFSPNPMGADGHLARGEAEAADRIAYGIPDVLGRQRGRYAGKRVLVVGAGHSAINAMLDLVSLRREEPGTQTEWAMRRDNLASVFGGEADALPARGALGASARAVVEKGDADILTPFRIHAIDRTGPALRVRGELGGREHATEADEIIVAAGFRPDLSALREVRIRLDPWLEAVEPLAPLIDPNGHSCGTVRPHGHAELSHPETDFYIVGMKSYGRAPTFLMATGYEQVRSTVAALAGDMEAAARVQLELPESGVCNSRPAGAALEESEADGGCCGVPRRAAAAVAEDRGPEAAPSTGGVKVMTNEQQKEKASGCCGGPAPEGVDACCVKDADAKAAGETGCGCGSAPEPARAPEKTTSACCG